MHKTIIGIDPGKSGAIAIIYPDGCIVTHKMDESEIVDILGRTKWKEEDCACYLEQVHAMPGQGVTSMFSFGNSYGFTRGVLQALEIPTELVRPQVWQKGLGGLKGIQGTARKRLLKAHAARLFPDLKPTLKTCDALLIARWGKQQ